MALTSPSALSTVGADEETNCVASEMSGVGTVANSFGGINRVRSKGLRCSTWSAEYVGQLRFSEPTAVPLSDPMELVSVMAPHELAVTAVSASLTAGRLNCLDN